MWNFGGFLFLRGLALGPVVKAPGALAWVHDLHLYGLKIDPRAVCGALVLPYRDLNSARPLRSV